MRIADRQKQALEILVEAEKAASELDLDIERAQIHNLRGNLYFPLGRIEECLAEHERSLRFARKAGSAEGEALALGGLGDGYYLRGHMRSASPAAAPASSKAPTRKCATETAVQ